MKFWETRPAQALLLLLVIAPPLFIGLGVADCEFHMEVRTLAAAQETWIRQQAEPQAWLLPSWNGEPRVNKPPLTVWLNMLFWTGHHPDSASVDQLVHRARLAVAILCLLALVATWGVGCLLMDHRHGLLAAAITGTSLLFLRTARLASYDTYLLAFSVFSVAGALYAMRPGQLEPPRLMHRATGWVTCGVAMALAFLTKGPIALVMTAAPLAFLIYTNGRKRANWIGLWGALCLAVLFAAPWYLYVLHHVPAADRIMGTEFKAGRNEFQEPWYYVSLLVLVAPWSVHLLAAGVGLVRRTLDWRAPAVRVPAIWGAVIVGLMSIPAAKQQRYIIPVLPAVGLLIAALVAPSMNKWTGSRIASGTLAWGLLFMSAVVAILGIAHPWLMASGWLKNPILVHLPPLFFTLLALPLASIAWRMRKMVREARLEAATWHAAAWMSLLATPALYDYGFSPKGRFAERAEVESVRQEVGAAPFYHAIAGDVPAQLKRPDPKMLLYGRRIIPAWTNGTPEPGAWLMAVDDGKLDRALRRSGWQAVRTFHDGNSPRRLYRAP